MKKLPFRKMASITILCVASSVALQAQTFTTLYTFTENRGGVNPSALVQGIDGNLYGTTQFGGPFNDGSSGTAFQLTPDGQLTTLYNFCAQESCTDGAHPNGLTLATNGNFYGTTQSGGRDCKPGNANGDLCGTVFEVTAGGELTTLYRFCSQPKCADGKVPEAGLVQDRNGNLYGTTAEGGANCVYAGGCGTVFEITPQGKLTTLYSFCTKPGCADGREPQAPLMMGADGNFYGTTSDGGNEVNFGYGTAFKITPAGELTTLYTFCSVLNCPDGAMPTAGLVQTVVAGNLASFGTTGGGGSWAGDGTIFEISASGHLATFYIFCPEGNLPCPDGFRPVAGLIQATDANLYGATEEGGTGLCVSSGCGTIYSINPNTASELTTLYNFCTEPACTDYFNPQTALVQSTDGNLYGTTPYTVYSLSMGLGPFVQATPNFGRPGQVVNILGRGLTGTTGIDFDSTPASFTVVSDTLITATVPSGAYTGSIRVGTPSGALYSNTSFQILP